MALNKIIFFRIRPSLDLACGWMTDHPRHAERCQVGATPIEATT